jgi:hypothetical protein
MKLFSCLFILLLLPLAPLSAATISGKTTVDGDAIQGVAVSAYPVKALNFSEPSEHVSKSTLADGLFNIDLPPGEYYLLAEGKELFSFYGRNPVTVPKEGLQDVNLLMLPDKLAVPDGESEVETGVAGYVSLDGEPVAGAVAMIYTDLSQQLKGMGLGWVTPSDETGYFEAPMPVGTYYLVIRVRRNGQMVGPLKAGDLVGYLPGNPLTVKEGGLTRVHIPLMEVPEKVSRHAANLFGNTSVSGRVVGPKGEPVAGLQVLLYEDSMMLNRPLYVSQKTDKDGRYQLSFPKGGRYYLAARNELGGTPAPGEFYGRYQGTPDHSIEIETGKSLADIEIVVDEVY